MTAHIIYNYPHINGNVEICQGDEVWAIDKESNERKKLFSINLIVDAHDGISMVENSSKYYYYQIIRPSTNRIIYQ